MKKIAFLMMSLGFAGAFVQAEQALPSFVKRLEPGVKVVQVLPGVVPQWKGSTGLLIGNYELRAPRDVQTYWRLDPSWKFQLVTDVIPSGSVVSSVTKNGRRSVLTQKGSPATVSLFRFEAGIESEILRVSEGQYECQWGLDEKQILCAKLVPNPKGGDDPLLNFTVLLESGKAFSQVYDDLLNDKLPLASGDAFDWGSRSDSNRLVFSYWNAQEGNSYLWCMDIKRKKDQISQATRLLFKTPSRLSAPIMRPGGMESLILEGVMDANKKLSVQHLLLVDIGKEKSYKLLTPEGSLVLAAEWSGKNEIVCVGRYGRGPTGIWKMGLDGTMDWIMQSDVFLNEDQRHAAKVAVSEDPAVLAFSLKGMGTMVLKLKE